MGLFKYLDGLRFRRSDFSLSKASFSNLYLLWRGDKLYPYEGEIKFEDPECAKKPFAPHYNAHIKQHVIQFEERRIDALYALRKRVMIAIPVGILTIISGVYLIATIENREKVGDVIVFICLMVLAGLTAWCNGPVKKYKSSVKSLIFPNIFSFFGPDFLYSEQGRLPIDSLKDSDLIPSYDSVHTEDYIKGAYKDVGLELMEAHLTQQQGSGKNRRTVTKFKGIYIILSMNKKFSGKTVVKKDGGGIVNWVSSKFNKLGNVKLEDPVFEKKFEVYSSDQVEARYLLTTSFMVRLLQLAELFDNSAIQCSFYENKLLLALPTKKNYFETESIFTPATFENDINRILKEMNVIFSIIDILKLDMKIGL